MKTRKLAILLSAATLAAGLSMGIAGAAHAASDPTIPSPTSNEITVPFDNAQGNPVCVDVPGGSMSPGTRLQLLHCHGYDSQGGPQRWHFDNTGLPAREYRIWNLNSGLCIGFDADGFHLTQQDCGRAPAWQEELQNANGTDPLIELVAAAANSPAMAASNLSDSNQTPLVAATRSNFTDSAQILELG